MSTFDGIVDEFPDIQIDFFRRNLAVRPPLACFLSHVHSDHLAGLESLKSPFVYCSAATRQMLLRLERYPCRINHAKGILEARVQTFKHLRSLLKPIPLETPTTLELSPGNHVQVTLFDANHCPGAVMFLIEGAGKAILYTGDIRSEPWFVNAISRNPCLVEYSGGIKRLDKIYLDTSFTKDVSFQTKAEGLNELLEKVTTYPSDTIFHFQAWTFGYEEVWVALSKALNSKIHVDSYKLGVYSSLSIRSSVDRYCPQIHVTREAASLVGFVCGNTQHPGCLTSDESVRIHSCEKGNLCRTAQGPAVISIQPIVAHLPDGDIVEVGIGGGGDDLAQEVELEGLSSDDIHALLQLIAKTEAISDDARNRIHAFLLDGIANGRNVSLDLEISSIDKQHEIQHTIKAMADKTTKRHGTARPHDGKDLITLTKTVTFPYSRHSSYPELCHLVSVFKPKDVWPCTVNPMEWLENGTSIRKLFGQHCSSDRFEYDAKMESMAEEWSGRRSHFQTQSTTSPSRSSQFQEYFQVHERPQAAEKRLVPSFHENANLEMESSQISDRYGVPLLGRKRHHEAFVEFQATPNSQVDLPTTDCHPDAIASEQATDARMSAFWTMLTNARGGKWSSIGLISTTDNHSIAEEELT